MEIYGSIIFIFMDILKIYSKKCIVIVQTSSHSLLSLGVESNQSRRGPAAQWYRQHTSVLEVAVSTLAPVIVEF